ncbi:carbohydrate binding family 9 domain-containing protein [Reichenbachiella carrageenanivorans]|uniref:Carbohydrate binding family 9 domain-containing protein n=1 Tax=Reichenbachiella carrageenanivorans TaxID=2979869 RepID=A0ABY6D165_9BACT|nr:carbohydrate binding family 9 domain-containing protein [Reichenbachiella carrageenanivorans]UXX78808.1 carbohydrate binding family 9 domain-containing protein [Reichenbachiella carrageenanivorans]
MATSVSAQDNSNQNFPPPEIPTEIRAIPTTEGIRIDGKLIEIPWKNAPVTHDFYRIEPRQGGTYRYQTQVRLLYDEKNLYVGVFCTDSLGKKGIRVQDLRRDFSWGENDAFGIQLDPQNLTQYCVSFQTTPYGNQRDMQNFNDNNTDDNWNALWTVRTHQTDSGYFAEFAIPFKSIRYERPEIADSVTWGITFTRLARREYEQTVFPAIPQSFSPYRMTYAAQLKGLTVPEPSANVRIEPYFLYQYEDTEINGQTISDDNVKLGGDIKWAINPRSVLDLTFNTDFAQADVDQAVNNLERFNVYFPEKRQFFLENSGIWAGAADRSVIPFFSRTIGLQGNFNAEPARIDGGARYTMRNDDRSTAGLYMHQAQTANSPAASFAVGRYIQNYGKENNVGIMFTHRLDEASKELGVTQSNNTTLTVDGLIRPKSELTFSYLLSGSRDNSNDTLGLAGKLFAGYNTNKFYLGWLTNFVTEDYNPDMGFVFQKNVIWHNPGGYFIWRPKSIPWIRRFDPGAFFNYYQDASDPTNFQQASIYLFPIYVYFTDGSFFEYAIYPTWQNINFDFAPLGISIAQDEYYYTRHQINYNSDQSRKLSVSGKLGWGGFYNGKRLTANGGLRYAPIPHVAFTADYEYNNLDNLGVLLEDLDTHLVTFGARFALNPRLQLSAFYQYNSFDEQGRWNVRGSWEYRPLSFIYLVFNDTQINGLEHPLEQQQLIGKVTFLKQF